jgi:hypothetical protein
MKVKLKNGEIVEFAERVANRYIRLGLASIVRDEPKPEPIKAEIIYDGIKEIKEITVIPEFSIEEVKPKKTKKKVKKDTDIYGEGYPECDDEL